MPKFRKKDYDDRLKALQVELNTMARWLQASGKRVLVIFEGRDTAGKGGVIASIAETLNPRQVRVVALPKPSEREQQQWYFQRYLEHLPAAGELVLFDRSWYNRAGVEQVMGFCTPAQTATFLTQAPALEKLLVDDGIVLFKYWLSVDQSEQEKRAARGSLEALEALAGGPEGAREIRRIWSCPGPDVRGHALGACALDGGRFQPAEARPAQPDP